ncbi:AAA family ATPase [Lederbergia lenta]|uniref:ABC transporter ATP-binding protein n=1 Tax=Lederbergia lenta TaxID=1467 RepID=A0A2X4WGZ4_LEDLE|nr:AAA family ATPase [Lederbergia lenta]MCM3112206.1 AAA family ATPase [Lederbergia lenta]MEC2323374.1 AAA family ATPase [Lederbergia lenta]SQI63306.1 ABC transporter ATP-binding protein [Lederbergia lenta]
MPLTKTDQYVRNVKLLRQNIPYINRYPFDLPAIQSLDVFDFHPQVTYLIGENGMGKSTLLEAIAIAAGFNPEGGTFNFNFSTHDSHSILEEYLRVVKGVRKPKDGFFLRAETYYNVATHIEKLDQDSGGPRIIDHFGGTSLHEQSHGESFFAAFLNRFRGKGLYIMDEPEAALSPLRQLSMLSRIHELVQQDSQFIIATHSPVLMAYPNSIIYEFSQDGIQEKELEHTNHYLLLKQFFDDKERILHHLFNE